MDGKEAVTVQAWGLWRSKLNWIGSNLIDTSSCTHRRGGSGWCRKCQCLLGFARWYNCWPHWRSSNAHFPKGAPTTCIQERDHTWIYVLYVGMTRRDYMYADTPDALASQPGMDWHRGPSFLQISVQRDSIEFLASPAGMAKYIWCFYVILYVVYMWLLCSRGWRNQGGTRKSHAICLFTGMTNVWSPNIVPNIVDRY